MPGVFKLVSIVIHTVIITLVLLAEVFDLGPLPTLHTAIAYDDFRSVRIADIALPTPPRRPSSGVAPGEAMQAAPLVAPVGVAAESEVAPSSNSTDSGLIVSVENGGGGLVGPGIVAGAGAPPPPPVETPSKPIPLHKGIQPPRKIVDVAPEYPALARAIRQKGIVILETIISAQGNVETVRVLRGYPLLDDAAVAAVQQWRFTPALLNGQPIPVVMTVTVNFELK
jgi:protein TonB